MSDLDYTGAHALGQLIDRCERQHVDFALARAGDQVRRSLERIGPDHCFPTVDAAVTALSGGPAPKAD
jgi:anti-anti-sigma regulatory factor